MPKPRSIARRVLLALLVAACSRDREPDAAPAPAPEAAPDREPSPACVEQVAEQEALLAKIPEDGLGLEWPADALVVLDDSTDAARAVDDDGLVIFAHPGGLEASEVRSTAGRTGNDRQAFLQSEIEINARTGGSGNVVVIAKRDTPWHVMAALFQSMLDVKKTEVDLVFARDVVIPPIPSSSIDEDLAALNRVPIDIRATRLAMLAERVVGPCKSLEQLFESLAALDSDARLRTILGGTPKALRDCDCSTDVAAVTSLVYALSVPDFVPAVVRISLAPASNAAETLALDGDTTWLDAHTRVIAVRDRPIAHVVK